MDSQIARRTASAALAATGALHLILAPEYLEEKAYVGALFIAGGLAAIAIAVRLWRSNDRIAWTAGALTAAGMAAGFVLSRTVGLPGFHESEWELSGLVSLVLEAIVVAVAARGLQRAPRLAGERA